MRRINPSTDPPGSQLDWITVSLPTYPKYPIGYRVGISSSATRPDPVSRRVKPYPQGPDRILTEAQQGRLYFEMDEEYT